MLNMASEPVKKGTESELDLLRSHHFAATDTCRGKRNGNEVVGSRVSVFSLSSSSETDAHGACAGRVRRQLMRSHEEFPSRPPESQVEEGADGTETERTVFACIYGDI